MNSFIPKPLVRYVFNIAIILLVAGFIISTFTEDLILLSAVLLIVFIFIIILMKRIYLEYIKPLDAASETIEAIINKNYQARFHATTNKKTLHLSNKINQLARELTDASIQEQMQSEQLSTLIDNTESGLVLLDERGYIHLVNRKFLKLFGKTEKDYVGNLYYKVINNEILQQTIQEVFLYEDSVRKGFSHYIGIEKLFIEISVAPIINEKKLLKGAVIALHDITELKKLEMMRKDFVANVSHELRTPITSIKGFSETLLDGDLEDKEITTQFLEIIYNESARLQTIIEDLLALSKLESENFQLVLNKFPAVEFVESIIPSLNYNAIEKGITLTTHIEDIEIKADKERLAQVVVNLVANAIVYSQEDGTVTLKISEKDNQVEIVVSDEGIGISEKDLPRIFERFYRVDKARARDSGGTGLGLAIVKHIIEVHDGEIQIESEVNNGTKITVLLPK
ncbi:two-component system histidine kinase PnpS [Oceanobacillus sp. CAU 1775]